jgi:hypothetical protein
MKTVGQWIVGGLVVTWWVVFLGLTLVFLIAGSKGV